jgi:outer membrane protein TolC
MADAVNNNQLALTMAQTQMRIGSNDLRFVEQRQLSLASTRSALIRMQAEQRIQRINLHLALGGGFEVPPPPAAEPAPKGDVR